MPTDECSQEKSIIVPSHRLGLYSAHDRLVSSSHSLSERNQKYRRETVGGDLWTDGERENGVEFEDCEGF